MNDGPYNCTLLGCLGFFFTPPQELAFASPMPGQVPTSKGAHYILNELLCYDPSRRIFEFPEPYRAEPSSVPSLRRQPLCFPQPLPENPAWAPTFSPVWPPPSLPHRFLNSRPPALLVRLSTGDYLGVVIIASKLGVVLHRAMSHAGQFVCFQSTRNTPEMP